MKKLLFPIVLALLFCGCQNLMHKEVQVVNHGKGGRIIINDPKSESMMPEIVFGQWTSIITTVPLGGKLKSSITTYQWWTGSKSIESTLEIDATQIPVDVLRIHTDYTAKEPVEVYSKEKVK